MKHTGFSFGKLSGVLALLAIAVLLFPLFSRPRENAKLSACPNNLKQISQGLLHYRQDFDNRLPRVVGLFKPTADGAYGWADGLQPYIRNMQVYQCPSDTDEGQDNPAKTGYTDYWFNRNLAGFDSGKVKSPAQTIVFGDGNSFGDLTDARYSLPGLPAVWMNDKESPAYHHFGGANYAFFDGHVKWFKPNQITTAPPAPGVYTFAIK